MSRELPDMRVRCSWCGTDPLYQTYHDEEWGVPLHEDRRLFEFLLLESFQAGLSWITILRKRKAFAAAFAQFDPQAVAAFGHADLERLMQDAAIVRNRAKIEAAIGNARAFVDIQQRLGSFDAYIWDFVDGRPLINHYRRHEDIPARTELSTAISRDLKQRGFRFVGPVVMYAHMQATGMVNDHVMDCFRHAELAGS